MQSEQINELAKALSKAQASLKDAKKDSDNPFFKSKYADLASVWDACRSALADNELAVVQTMDYIKEGSVPIINTVLMHSSGQWIGGELAITPKNTDPQSIGSAITYARRYALAAIVGVSPADDDAEDAMDRKTEKARPTLTAPLRPVQKMPKDMVVGDLLTIRDQAMKLTPDQQEEMKAQMKQKGYSDMQLGVVFGKQEDTESIPF